MKVVHCKKEKYDVYIGRPSIWGNPFSHRNGTKAEYIVETREQAVDMYKEWIKNKPELIEKLPELKDKVLGCWCKPLACHGDVLLELIEKISPKRK